MKKIVMVIGTRPNYMKVVPLYDYLHKFYKVYLVHTGQHYDNNLNYIFKKELELPEFDFTLNLSSKSIAGDIEKVLYKDNKNYILNMDKVVQDLMNLNNIGQLGEIRDKLINIIYQIKPDLVMVFGDVTSTLSAALACKLLNIKIAHVESGLRSLDLKMPEEVNRKLIDHITDYFFITEKSGYDNLKNEGKNNNLFLVGNPMISCLQKFIEKIKNKEYYKEYGFESKKYILITLHRPSNVDNKIKLKETCNDIIELSKKYKIIFPLHPRTKKNFNELNLNNYSNNLILCESLGYFSFINLLLHSMCVITDSGGVQEEATCLGIQCFTLRNNTERPSTLLENGGTNQLIQKITLNLEYGKQYNQQMVSNNVGEKVLNILKLLI